MAANTSHGSTATPTKDSPPNRGRDTREGAQYDDSTDRSNSVDASQNSPPDHGIPTHGIGRFLWEVDKDTPVSELGKRYREWRDETEQSELDGWSE